MHNPELGANIQTDRSLRLSVIIGTNQKRRAIEQTSKEPVGPRVE